MSWVVNLDLVKIQIEIFGYLIFKYLFFFPLIIPKMLLLVGLIVVVILIIAVIIYYSSGSVTSVTPVGPSTPVVTATGGSAVVTPVIVKPPNVPTGYPATRHDGSKITWNLFPNVSRLPNTIVPKSSGTTAKGLAYKYLADVASAAECATKLQAGQWGGAFDWFLPTDHKYPKQCYALSNFNEPPVASNTSYTATFSKV